MGKERRKSADKEGMRHLLLALLFFIVGGCGNSPSNPLKVEIDRTPARANPIPKFCYAYVGDRKYQETEKRMCLNSRKLSSCYNYGLFQKDCLEYPRNALPYLEKACSGGYRKACSSLKELKKDWDFEKLIKTNSQ